MFRFVTQIDFDKSVHSKILRAQTRCRSLVWPEVKSGGLKQANGVEHNIDSQPAHVVDHAGMNVK